MQNENKAKVVACVVSPQFVFPSLLHILPCLNAFLQNTLQEPHKQKLPMQETNYNNKYKNRKFDFEIESSN
jgi:hypothetical protein